MKTLISVVVLAIATRSKAFAASARQNVKNEANSSYAYTQFAPAYVLQSLNDEYRNGVGGDPSPGHLRGAIHSRGDVERLRAQCWRGLAETAEHLRPSDRRTLLA